MAATSSGGGEEARHWGQSDGRMQRISTVEAADGEGGNSGAGVLSEIFFITIYINNQKWHGKKLHLLVFSTTSFTRSKLGGGHRRHSFRRRHLCFNALSYKNLDDIVFIIMCRHLYFLVLR